MIRKIVGPCLLLGFVLTGALLFPNQGAAQAKEEALKPETLKKFLEDILEEPRELGKEGAAKYKFFLEKKRTINGSDWTLRPVISLTPDNSMLEVAFNNYNLPYLEGTPGIHLANLLAVNKTTAPGAFHFDVANNSLVFRLSLETKGLTKKGFRTQLEQAIDQFAKHQKLWDMRLWTFPGLKQTYTGFTNEVRGHAVSPDGKLLAGSDWNGNIIIRNISNGEVVAKMEGSKKGVLSLTFSDEGKGLITGEAGGVVREWDVKTGKPTRSFSGHKHYIWAMALSKDGTRLATAGGAFKAKDKPIDLDGKPTDDGDYVIRVWDVKTGKELQKFEGHTGMIKCVALSSDGKILMSGSDDKTVRIWDVKNGKEQHKSDAHGTAVEAVVITPDGRGISGASPKYDDVEKKWLYEKTIRVWDLTTGKESKAFGAHNVWSISLSNDGKQLLTSGQDKTLRLWDIGTGKQLKLLAGHRGATFRSCFLPGDKQAVSASFDFNQCLWDLVP